MERGSKISLIEIRNVIKNNEIPIGKHMDLSISYFKKSAPLILADGKVIHPGEKIGLISFNRDIPKLKAEDNLFPFIRYLHREAEVSLKLLAELCVINDPKVEDIEVFYGNSHLVGQWGARMGFDVFDVPNSLNKSISTLLGKQIVWNIARKNSMWGEYSKTFKPAQEAYISRNKLIEYYS